MKKISILIVLSCVFGCTPETDQAPVEQQQAKPSLYRRATEAPQYRQNPYDLAGVAFDSIFNSYFAQASQPHTLAAMSSKVTSLARINADFNTLQGAGASGSWNVANKVSSIASSPAIINTAVQASRLTPKGKASLGPFLESVNRLYNESDEYAPLYSLITTYENSVLANPQLNDSDKEMLGTGVNAQKRAVAIHHLDTPWRPSDLAQRDGRAIRKGNEIAKFFADNKVDVVIYAVEKSLDSYKFNLLYNKQLFIDQLKNNNLGKRTIDEGSMDEKSGMNFSEYVAILSGNTDLLDKAKIEKQIAGLESEKQSFNRSKSSAKYKLQDFTEMLQSSESRVNRMSLDWNNLQQRVQKRSDGAIVNLIQLDGLLPNADIKQIGTKLNQIADKARTGGDYQEIGSLYGFQLLVKTEMSEKEGVDIRVNRFLIQGEGNIKYTFNNGIIAKDEKLAAMNFLNALEKLPSYIEQEKKKIAEIQKDLPVLQEVINGTWSKENRLSELKTELAAVERKIQLSITPETKEESIEQVDKQKESPNISESILRTKGIHLSRGLL